MRQQGPPAAARLIEVAIELERRLIVAGWYNSTGLYEAVIEHRLGAKRLVDPPSAFLFAYICVCAEQGQKPCWDHAAAIADYCGTSLTSGEILSLLLVTDYVKDDLDDYGFGVATLADKRERATHHWREYVKLAGADDQTIPRLDGRVVA